MVDLITFDEEDEGDNSEAFSAREGPTFCEKKTYTAQQQTTLLTISTLNTGDQNL